MLSEGFQVHPTPWKAILTSLPVWGLFATQTGNNYCFWTLLTQIPSYMNYVMHFDIKSVSLMTFKLAGITTKLITEQFIVFFALFDFVAVEFCGRLYFRRHNQQTYLNSY